MKAKKLGSRSDTQPSHALSRYVNGSEAKGGGKVDGRPAAAQARTPANALSPAEPQRLLGVANRPELAGQPPSPIVPRLADRGESLASEATFYRVLRAADPRAHRGKAKAPSHHRPQAWVATGPHPLWSGESTDLAGAVAGLFFYLDLTIRHYKKSPKKSLYIQLDK